MVDRIVALAFGRPVLLLDEDCDVDLPGKVDEKGVTAPHSLHFFRTSISVVSLLDPIIQLDAVPGNESHDVDTMMKIDAQLLACWCNYPDDLTDDNASGSIEPSTLKILFITQQARLALFRHCTNSDLSHTLRNACLKKSVEISRVTAKIMLRVAKKDDWQNGFAHRCNDMVYNHIFRASIVLLLEHRLKTSSNLAKLQARPVTPNKHINILWQSLRAAAEAHLSAAKSLELLQVFANTLNIDPSLTEEVDEGYQPGNANITDPLTQQHSDMHLYNSLSATDISIGSTLGGVQAPTPSLLDQPSAIPNSGLGAESAGNAFEMVFPGSDHTQGLAADNVQGGLEKFQSPSHYSMGSDDMDWAMFHELLNHDSIFGMYAGGGNGNESIDF